MKTYTPGTSLFQIAAACSSTFSDAFGGAPSEVAMVSAEGAGGGGFMRVV